MEQVHIRINDHQILNGVKEYSVEVAVAGKYVRTFIGTSQEDFAPELADSFRQIFTMVGIPATVLKQEPTTITTFFDENGNKQPVSPFAAHATARFEAQVIRNGKVVED